MRNRYKMKKIETEIINLNCQKRIKLILPFENREKLIKIVKKIKGSLWYNEKLFWHIPYRPDYIEYLNNLFKVKNGVTAFGDNSEMKKFSCLIKKGFDDFLDDNGFKVESKLVEEYFCTHIYTKKKQYIMIEADIHPLDIPSFFNIILGIGTPTIPSRTKESVALWRLIRELDSKSNASEYPIEKNKNIEKEVSKAKFDLEFFGKDFLNGKLASLKKAIRTQVDQIEKGLQSYKNGR